MCSYGSRFRAGAIVGGALIAGHVVEEEEEEKAGGEGSRSGGKKRLKKRERREKDGLLAFIAWYNSLLYVMQDLYFVI